MNVHCSIAALLAPLAADELQALRLREHGQHVHGHGVDPRADRKANGGFGVLGVRRPLAHAAARRLFLRRQQRQHQQRQQTRRVAHAVRHGDGIAYGLAVLPVVGGVRQAGRERGKQRIK